MSSGVDSVTPAYRFQSNGQALAKYVQSYFSGKEVFEFWGRYFGNNGQFGTSMNNESTSPTNYIALEALWMKSAGITHIVPINAPGNTYLGTSDGYAAGQAGCDGIVKVVQNSGGRIAIPGGNAVNVYLDVEQGQTLTLQYWNGWSSAVDGYSYNGSYPFYACCYTEPNSQYNTQTPCPVLCDSSANICYALWSNSPEDPAYCTTAPPSWGPDNCACGNIFTSLWQYDEAIPTLCLAYSGFPPVDLDKSNPNSSTELNKMLYLP